MHLLIPGCYGPWRRCRCWWRWIWGVRGGGSGRWHGWATGRLGKCNWQRGAAGVGWAAYAGSWDFWDWGSAWPGRNGGAIGTSRPRRDATSLWSSIAAVVCSPKHPAVWSAPARPFWIWLTLSSNGAAIAWPWCCSPASLAWLVL